LSLQLAALSLAQLGLIACGAERSYYVPDGGWAGTDVPYALPFDGFTQPPEVEEMRSFLTPRAGGRYVYIANPLRDSVAVIDSQTLAIRSVEVGRRPTTLNTMDGRDECIVLNSGANTASILRTVDGVTTTSQVPTLEGANAIAIASDARHAIVYYDSTVPNADNRRANFQDITLITLQPGMDRAVQLTVGFRALSVLFSQDGTAAYVLTEDGISILRFADITGPTILPSVSLQDQTVEEVSPNADAGSGDASDASGMDVLDAQSPPDAAVEQDASDDSGDSVASDSRADVTAVDADVTEPEDASVAGSDAGAERPNRAPVTDVTLTPDGRYAIARVQLSGIVRLIDLRNRSVQSLNTGAEISDLDLAPNGTFAIAVQRESSRVLRIAVPGAFNGTAAIRRTEFINEVVGSVSIAPDNASALLYTTALDVRRVLMMDLAANTATVPILLRKHVRSVTYAPDSRVALIVHRFTEGDPNQPGSLQSQIDRSRGYSLLDLRNRFVKLQLTPTDVGPFALVPGGAYAFLLFRDDMLRVAMTHRVNLRSFEVNPLTLGSPPISVGAVPATQRVFVGQEHPEGRISFINWDTGAVESLTGFELNSRIVR
jgi:YVTN family beta-propeller protein